MKILAWTLLSFFCVEVFPSEDVDYLQLAGVLIKDQKLEKAENILAKAENEVGPENKQLLFLKGHYNLQLKNFEEALNFLNKAEKQGLKDPFLSVYRAQAYFQMKNYEESLKQLEVVPLKKLKLTSIYLLQAQSYWHLKNWPKSLASLDEGMKVIPQDPSFLRQKVLNWMELGLYEQASTDLQLLLKASNYGLKDYLSFAQKFESVGQNMRGELLREEALLHHYEDAVARAELASSYLKDGKRYVAAELFAEATLRDERFSYQAAELFRQIGQIARAKNIVAFMLDPQIQAKQKLALMIEEEKFSTVKSLEKKMKGLGLLQDEELSYAISYALFKGGHLQDSKKYLKNITSDKLFSKAVELRKAIDQCVEKDWSCYDGF